MISLHFIIEESATIIESLVALSAVSIMCVKLERKRYLISLVIGTSLLSGLITLLNSFQSFSFVTIFLSILFVFLFSHFLSEGNTLIRATATIFTYFVIHSVDYIIFFCLGIATESPIIDRYTFSLLLAPGFHRYVFLFVDKGIDMLLLLALRPVLSKLNLLSSRYLGSLLLVTTLSYTIMSILLAVIFETSVLALQIAILLSWLFIITAVFLSFSIFLISTRYHSEKETNQLLTLSNTIVEKSFRDIEQKQEVISKFSHDFNHHIAIIRDLAQSYNCYGIINYTSSLLAESLQYKDLCQCGNKIIDAIINCKSAEAKNEGIAYKYTIDLPNEINIMDIDICAILANQIENALDACRLINPIENRTIKIHIWQQTDSIIIFQVSNSAKVNPFENNKELLSTKLDQSRPHGLGVKNIKETAKKYNGVVENTYKSGTFYSTVLLCVSPYVDRSDNRI